MSFDGNWNGYSGPSYINAYKKIVDILRAEGVNNVAYGMASINLSN